MKRDPIFHYGNVDCSPDDPIERPHYHEHDGWTGEHDHDGLALRHVHEDLKLGHIVTYPQIDFIDEATS